MGFVTDIRDLCNVDLPTTTMLLVNVISSKESSFVSKRSVQVRVCREEEDGVISGAVT